MLNAAQWRVGDEIILASTDFDPRQAERRTIAAISGNKITLDKPLDYMHFGKITFDVDERGEVGLLTRNIKVQASADAEQSFFGGHIMAMPSSHMYVEGVELSRMGQNLTLARYPIHWHLVGDAKGQYIKNAAIHDTYNRCVTVHGTNFVRVENNVTYNIVGHCFFLEDGIEHGNEFVHNLAIQIKCHTSKRCVPTNLAANGDNDYPYEKRLEVRKISFAAKDTLLPSDNTVAAFWITNPDNHFIDNVAAGSDENGFWLSLPEHPQGQFAGTDIAKSIWPRRTRMGTFRGNVAHSNFDGFMFDRNIGVDNTFGLTGNSHMPTENPADPNSKRVETLFENLTSYKNRNGGIWGRGEAHIFRNVKLADNAIGYTHASGSNGKDPLTSLVVDSLFVGETENIGNPVTPEEVAYKRSLPKRLIPDFPIRGYEYYDYRHDVVEHHFRELSRTTPSAARERFPGCCSRAPGSPRQHDQGARIRQCQARVFPEDRQAIRQRQPGWRGLPDRGVPGPGRLGRWQADSYILIHDGENDSVATDNTCKIQPTWNAAVCTGDVGRLFLNKPNGTLADLGAGSPVTLRRNGKDFRITGNQSNVRSGTEIQVKTERQEMSLSVREMDQGSWVMFELPGFTNAASGKQQDSLDALRKASETSYFRDKDALWVKLVVTDADFQGPVFEPVGRLVAQATMTVSR